MMNLSRLLAAAACLTCGLVLGEAHADWPGRVFAPYVFLGDRDRFQLTECEDACGQKFYTLAFIIADKEGNPTWYGRVPLEQNLYVEQIAAIRQRGGDVIVSFGGEAGNELALAEKDVDKLAEKYQAVVDRYQFTWLDLDVEGKALSDTEANKRRNAALAKLQSQNPKLLVSYTLPVDPDGISDHAQRLLADAKTQGLKVHSANVMTMYFGPRFTKDKTLAEVSIASAKKAYEQCQAIDPAIKIGLTPMIGRGGEGGSEVFSLDDAKALRDWAAEQPWVCSLSFWSANRDSGKPGRREGTTRSGIQQEPWAFTKGFQQFTRE